MQLNISDVGIDLYENYQIAAIHQEGVSWYRVAPSVFSGIRSWVEEHTTGEISTLRVEATSSEVA